MHPSRPAFAVILLAMALAAAGCGPPAEKTVTVRGKVTDAGAPLVVEGRDIGLGMVQIHFYRIEEAGGQSSDPYSALVQEDGTFEIAGHSRPGIPPGKYRIAVYQWDPYPQTDRLEGRFSETESPIVREISTDAELDLDLSRPEG